MTVRRVATIALSPCTAGLLTTVILRRRYAPALEFREVALIGITIAALRIPHGICRGAATRIRHGSPDRTGPYANGAGT